MDDEELDCATITADAATPAGVRPTAWWRRAWQTRVGGLPRAYWWLWTGMLVNRAGGFVQPFLVLYLTGPRTLTTGQAGVILVGLGAGACLSQPIGGALADRIGRRPTVVLGMLATAVMLATLGVAHGFGLLLVLAFGLGLVGDVYRPASTAAVADLLPESARTRAYVLQFWAINLGFSVAAVLGGALAAHGFTLLFVVDAVTCAVFAVVVGLRVPETGRVGRTRPDEPRFAGLRVIAHDRLLQATIGLMFLYAVLYGQVYAVLPLTMRDIGLSTAAYGIAIAVNGVAIVVAQPLLLPLLERCPRIVLVPASVAVLGGGLALTALAHGLVVMIGTVLIWTVGEIGYAGTVQTLVMALAPVELRGRYSGATGLAWGGASLVGPVAATAAYAAFGAAMWWASLVLGLIAAGGYVRLVQLIERRPSPA